MTLRALLILVSEGVSWGKEMELPFAPFPGLGIRVDVYEVLNVTSVLIGDPGYDVTCIVEWEERAEAEFTERLLTSLGFEEQLYP